MYGNGQFVTHFSGHRVETCIVVRHLSPADEQIIDGSNGDSADEPPAKRPYRKLQVRAPCIEIGLESLQAQNLHITGQVYH